MIPRLIKLIKKCESNIDILIIAFTLIAGVIGVCLNLYGSNDALIVALLVIISVNLILIIYGYLKKYDYRLIKINTGIEDLLKNTGNVFLEENYFNFFEKKISEATNDVFLSGIALHRLTTKTNLIVNWNEKVQLRLLSLDLNEKTMMQCFHKMRYEKSEHSIEAYQDIKNVYNNKLGESLKGKSNIYEKISQRIIPCSFFAIDINKPNENSFIKVDYYIPEKRISDKTISFFAFADTELFDVLKDQIDDLWNSAVDVVR